MWGFPNLNPAIESDVRAKHLLIEASMKALAETTPKIVPQAWQVKDILMLWLRNRAFIHEGAIKIVPGNSRSPMCMPRPEKVDNNSSFRIIPRPESDSQRQLEQQECTTTDKLYHAVLGSSAVENSVI